MAKFSSTKILSLAIEYFDAGRRVESKALGEQLLDREPNSVGALHLLSVIALHEGRYEHARELTRKALALAPQHAAIHTNLGESCRQLALLDEAVASFRRALKLQPNNPDALNNLGLALTSQGRFDEAITCLTTALSFRAGQADAHYNLAVALNKRHRFDEAIAAFEAALALKPNFPEALNNLGDIFNHRGQLDRARTCFERALELKPSFAEAYNNLGNYFKEIGRSEEAVVHFRRACELRPKETAFHSNLILALQYQSGDEAGVLKPELERWNREHVRPLAASIPPHVNERSPNRRLRIGYVSPDFRDHAVGLNLLPLLKNHAHEECEIFCYAAVPLPDLVTTQIRACADHWRDIFLLTDGQLADLIRTDKIDILVDLALHTANNRLLTFARKPAPIQVSFAGYPGGTGVETIDYHLTDPHLEPADSDKAFSSDAPFRLPDTFWCYASLATELPVGSLPALTNGHVTFGCLNNFCKVNDSVLRLWARVLAAVPCSRIALLTNEGLHRKRTVELLSAAGVDADRITFFSRAAREKYLTFYRNVDLGLDTVPYNGHTTSLDSYWMGVPVVSLVGSSTVGRAGLSQLSNLQLPELAADSEDYFVDTACMLARDIPRLTALREGLRDRIRASPLMDAVRFARNIEAAYRIMWHRWCAQAAPSSL